MRVINTTEAIMTNAAAGQQVIDILYTLGVNPEYLDDHRQEPTLVKPWYVLLLTDGQITRVCPVGPQVNGVWAFSLNPLYLQQGDVHLSTLAFNTFHIRKDCPIGEAADLFNQEAEANPFCDWRITAVVGL